MKKCIVYAAACMLIAALLTGCAGTTVVINECNCDVENIGAGTAQDTNVQKEETESKAEEVYIVCYHLPKKGTLGMQIFLYFNIYIYSQNIKLYTLNIDNFYL